MRKQSFLILAMLLIATFTLGGCAAMGDMFDTGEEDEMPLVCGTSGGNIINGGFAAQYGDELLVYYTGQSTYDFGNIISSNLDSGDTSLVLTEGGLYMNVVGDRLFYCREDGVYAASLSTYETQCIMEKDVSLLQLNGDTMYFIEDGRIDSATTEGQSRGFSPIDDAAWLNVYGGTLYYVDTQTGHICTADKNGEDVQVIYDKSVDMIVVVDDVIYFIDSADGYIKRMLLSGESLETVAAYSCSGFNVNRQGMYYTRDVDGQSLCCNAGAEGYQESVIADFGQSEWHRVCMFGDTAIVVGEKDIAALQ